MKRIVLFLILTCAGIALHAQSMKVQSAISDFKNKRLDKAKNNIDAASVHDATKEDPKTWFYKSAIYSEIAITEKYKNLVENPLEISFEAAMKCREYDKKAELVEQNKTNFQRLSILYFSYAADKYTEKNFTDALKYFELVTEINKYSGDNTNTINAYTNAAISAQQLNDTTTMIKMYTALIRTNSKDLTFAPYNALYRIYKDVNDTSKGVKLALQVTKKFNKDYNAYIILADAFFWVGENEKAKEAIDSVLSVNPENAKDTLVLNALGGLLFDAGDVDGAMQYYSASLQINPNQVNTNFLIGVAFYNKAAEFYSEAIKLDQMKQGSEVEKLLNQGNDYFKKAIPFLEKSIELNPNNISALTALKKIYVRLEMDDKLTEVNEKIKALENK